MNNPKNNILIKKLTTKLILPIFQNTTFHLIFFILLLLFPNPVFSQNPPPIIPPNLEKETLLLPHSPPGSNEGNFIQSLLLPSIASTVIILTGAFSLLFTIIGGILMITAYGDETRFAKGKKTIIWALAGIIIGTLSYAIVTAIASIRITT